MTAFCTFFRVFGEARSTISGFIDGSGLLFANRSREKVAIGLASSVGCSIVYTSPSASVGTGPYRLFGSVHGTTENRRCRSCL